MEKFVIIGGNRLSGTIRVSGGKNSVLTILPACLLSGGVCTLHDVPKLSDVYVMKNVLESLGAKVDFTGNTMVVDATSVSNVELPDRLTRMMRASNLVMGPLLARFQYVKMAYPGGCSIGSRPMDQHLRGMKTLGAEIKEKHGFIEAKATRLVGSEICLDFPSVGATENILLAATLAEGVTVIRNAAREPEVVDLQNFLNQMGAKIKGAGTDVIRIEGVKKLNSVEYTIIPDRIEAGTFMVMGAITGGEILINNVIPEHIEAVISKLREAGVEINETDEGILVRGGKKRQGVDVKTMPFPGFPTDMQAQMMALMAVSEGTSIVTETIFENRFKHVDELRRMGADIKVEGRVAIIKGVKSLSGAYVETSDLRAGAALVTAGLVADGATVLDKVHLIDRGYENFEQKLRGLGAQILRVNGNGGKDKH
ncbi:MAG TPA: UDP-N-acetylglucosamine 1-carboxyvinyltransferase [Peptococcaceae bacterium]|nr:UDP-N-acetylglucosamine 1-carboxyvinyltransferase [Clostridia bacterium]HOB81820.1 UDP-N-acetylglucosamine 1-carboxyvinyltransferase [Peptococcaceae bacterium]HPZ71679.1 UDP-N-acetylglucosamine 1-carboxyvinyltransferase [Peptococcaceae bacterium]HQD53726.1 UDP-N-acetylglucosamine 1-carboxyvinyltransferase [Peptococcaceae bacterium]